MTEEVKVEDQVLENVQEEKEVDPVQAKALEMGWRPLEEFDGDPADFIDAKEFVSRTPLYEKLNSQSKLIKNLQKTLDQLKGHYTKVKETEYNRALEQLKNARITAVSEGDGQKFDLIDTEIKRIEQEAESIKEINEAVVEPPEKSEHPQFTAWKAKNRWYENTGYMQRFADETAAQYFSKGIIDPNVVLPAIEAAVKKEFPDKFKNQNKVNAPEVASGDKARSGKRETFTLTDDEQRVMNTFVRSGVMTKEEYIADLKKIKGVA